MDEQLITTPIQVSPHYYFKKSLVLIQQGKVLDALQHIDCAIVFSSHSPFYIYQKIKFLFETDDFITCSDYILEKVHFLHKHASLYIVCKIIHYYELMNHTSVEHLKEILAEKEVPYCLASEYKNILNCQVSNLFYFAQEAASQDDFLLCIDYCNLMIKQNKLTWEMLYLAAYSYHMAGSVHKACEYYKKCIMMNSKNDKVYNDLGLALMELCLYNEALECLNKARDLSPENIDYLSHIAECYYALRAYSLSQETYEEIIRIHPSYLQIYFNLSHICKKQNKNFLSKKYMKLAKKTLRK